MDIPLSLSYVNLTSSTGSYIILSLKGLSLNVNDNMSHNDNMSQFRENAKCEMAIIECVNSLRNSIWLVDLAFEWSSGIVSFVLLCMSP